MQRVARGGPRGGTPCRCVAYGGHVTARAARGQGAAAWAARPVV